MTTQPGRISGAHHTGHAAQGNHTTRHTQTSNTRAATSAPGADSLGAAPQPQDAFLALLSALGVDAPLEAQSQPLELESDPGEVNTTLLPETIPTIPTPTPTAVTDEQRSQQSMSSELLRTIAAQLAQSARAAGAASGQEGNQANQPYQPYGLVAQTALMDKAAELAQDRGLTLNLAAKSGTVRWMGADASTGDAQTSLSASAGSSTSTSSSASTNVMQLLQSMRPTSTELGGGYSAAGVATGAAGMREDAQLHASASDAAQRAAGAQELLGSTSTASDFSAGSGFGTGTGTGAGQSGAAGNGGGGASAGGQALTYATPTEYSSTPPEASAFAPDAAPASAEEQALAEQVAFWVNQDRQSAELTLQRDGQPVQVRVQLNGNEAHVSFLSDQAHTREALDAGMEQLRQLLQEQGLTLAGTSVQQRSAGEGLDAGGASAQGQSGREGREGREGRTTVSVAVAGTTDKSASSASASTLRMRAAEMGQRNLDIFV